MQNFLNITMGIIAVTVVISFLCFSNQALRQKLIFWPPAIKQNQFHRFITHGFIHADGNHLLFNMITLYFFGVYVERLYEKLVGGFGFVLFYLSAIIVAMIPTYLAQKNNQNYYSLGASGAVSAVLFTFILVKPWSKLYLFFAIPIPAIIFAMAYTAYSIWAERRNKDNINHSAHLWGAAYGVVVTALLEPKLISHFIQQLMQPFA